MSEFRVPIVQIAKVGKHPNADTLSITTIEGCPVIFRTGDFNQGDLAIYIPVDAVVPDNVPGTEFLERKRRIKALKLRGIFSMGILLPISILANGGGLGLDISDPARPNFVTGYPVQVRYELGQDIANILGIKKYEEPEPIIFSGNARAPHLNVPVYDIESHRKYKHVYEPSEMIVVTEKVHGCNSRFVWNDGDLHIGSHEQWKAKDNQLWGRIAKQYGLERLKNDPGYVVFGETYGQVQDLRYGTNKGELRFAVFDVYNAQAGCYLDHNRMQEFADRYQLPTVPVVYTGEIDESLLAELAEGESIVSTVPQIKEGIVIKPLSERWHPEIGRVITKLVSEQYHTRKGGTEYH